MDVNDITKVASRKRLNMDAEKLREKVSRETAKIIKLKVAQDTAYWDLKEKLQQVEGNHERLQQNMVEVQMQHEAISGQYQDELRLRPDTLNKLSSTREICDVLEEYSERLKETLSRCKNDQASLCEAYQKSGSIVRKMKQDHELNDEKNKQLIKSLKEKVTSTKAHQMELLQVLSDSKSQVDQELATTKMNLNNALEEKQQLTAAMCASERKLQQCFAEIQTRDKIITQLEGESKKTLENFTSQNAALKEEINQKINELAEATETIKSLRHEIDSQKCIASELCEENSQLKEQLQAMGELLKQAQAEHNQLTIAMQAVNQNNEDIKYTVFDLTTRKDELEKLITEKHKALQETEEKLEQLKLKLADLEETKLQLTTKLEEATTESEKRKSQNAELEAKCRQLESDNKEIETALKSYREENEAKMLELKRVIEENEKELGVKASTIGQLMSEVGTAGETAARLEATLQNLKVEADLQRQAAVDRENHVTRQLEHAQNQVEEKEKELSKQMTILLDMRSEKERLQDKIQCMQNKIDNIQKELSGPHPRPLAGDAPELDDNALAFAPTPRVPPRVNTKPQGIMHSPPPKPQKKHKHPESGKHESMLFSIFSDTSLDGDSNMIDSREVNRRFEALTRGEPVAPASINTLKRRKDMSLSQVKKSLKIDEPRKFFKNVRAVNKK